MGSRHRRLEGIIRRGRESENRPTRSAWGAVMAVGTAVAVAIGAGAAVRERVQDASEVARLETRVKDECRRVPYDTDRMVCEESVRREIFGRAQ